MDTNRQIRELSTVVRTTKNPCLYERYLAVKLVLEGFQIKELAQIISRKPHAVGHYVDNYRAGEIEALALQKQPGHPRRLTEEMENKT